MLRTDVGHHVRRAVPLRVYPAAAAGDNAFDARRKPDQVDSSSAVGAEVVADYAVQAQFALLASRARPRVSASRLITIVQA